MKRLLILIGLVLLSTLAFSQFYGKSKVLNVFYVGFDNEKKIKEVTGFDELEVYSDFNTNDEISRIILNEYMYKGRVCKVVLVLVNDVLFSATYYPSDKSYYKYVGFLNESFIRETGWKNPEGEVVWSNEVLIITKGIDGNFDEFFIHYNKEMLKKYQQYKNL